MTTIGNDGDSPNGDKPDEGGGPGDGDTPVRPDADAHKPQVIEVLRDAGEKPPDIKK